jgi:putative spermidine/putrescine transport system substrate-binding protein
MPKRGLQGAAIGRPAKCVASALLLALTFLSSCDRKAQDDEPVRLVSWGSQLQADLMAEIVRPAAQRGAVQVRDDSWTGDYADLTTRIDRGINTWDLVHVDGVYVLTPRWKQLFYQDPSRGTGQLSKTLLESSELAEPLRQGFAVPILEYGYLIAGRQSQFSGRPITQMTWKDFWDVRTLPGQRGMRDSPVGNVEAALESLGVKSAALYGEQDPTKIRDMVSRAFVRLAELAPNVTWWNNGEALQQGLESGDTPLTAAWSGRVRSSFNAVCPNNSQSVQACDVQISQGSSLISTDWWIIPANAKNKEAASRLLKETISVAAVPGAARFAAKQGYAVPLDGAAPTDSVARYFINAGSSSNKLVLGRISEQFWGKHLDWISKEWAKFRAEH